jgi:Integral membrane protein DUF92
VLQHVHFSPCDGGRDIGNPVTTKYSLTYVRVGDVTRSVPAASTKSVVVTMLDSVLSALPFVVAATLSGNVAPIVCNIVVINGVLVSGYRKRSLSLSGAAAAFLIGFTMMSIPLRVFGVTLIAFYLIGSKAREIAFMFSLGENNISPVLQATKVGKSLKAKLEEGHQEAGYRTAWQVSNLSHVLPCDWPSRGLGLVQLFYRCSCLYAMGDDVPRALMAFENIEPISFAIPGPPSVTYHHFLVPSCVRKGDPP